MADGEKRIKELEEITALTSNDYFVVDSSASGGKTKKYKSTYITDIINNIPELVAEFEPNHYYDRDALVAHEGKVYYHNAPGASYEEFPTGYQFIQIDLTGLLSRLGFGISIQHNSSFTYNKGDYCMEDYILYRCLNDNVTGAWSSSDWERASLGYDLSSIYKPRLDEHDEQIEEALALGTANGTIATFTDGSTLPMRKLEVDIEPVQDLHGYDNPWVGGSGKNKLPNTATTTTSNGVTFTVRDDGSVLATGRATADAGLVIWAKGSGNKLLSDGDYVLNGCPSGGSSSTYYISSNGFNGWSDTGNGGNMSIVSTYNQTNILIIIKNGYAIPSGGLLFKPMIRLASVTDATFAPYSNICPISGWDECNVTRCGKNLASVNSATAGSGNVDIYNGIGIQSDITISFKCNNFSFTNGWASIALIVDSNNQSHPITPTGFGLSANTVYNNRVSGTYNINYKFKRIFIPTTGYTNMSGSLDDIQIELGATATDYGPYNGQTYTIDLDGTRYGGKLDVVSGVLTVDRVGVDLSSVSFTYDSNNKRWNRQFGDMKNYSARSADLMFEQYQATTSAYTGDTGTAFAYGKDIYIYDANQSLTISGKCVYELATPQTIQLTPTEVKTLLATNNIFADTGDIIDATYIRNANITINDLISRIEALENA